MYLSGIDPTTTSATPVYGLGDLGANVTTAGTKVYMYVRAAAAISANFVVDINGSTYAAAQTTTTSGAPGTGTGKSMAVAPISFASGDYGWVQVYGNGLVQVAASCAAYTNLNTTATAGQIDDDATTGARRVDGIILNTARAASAGTASAWINWPRIGSTIQ